MRTFRTLVSVFFCAGLKWPAGKLRAFAFANRVNMNRLQTRSKSLDIHVDRDFTRAFPKCRAADGLPSLSLSSAVA